MAWAKGTDTANAEESKDDAAGKNSDDSFEESKEETQPQEDPTGQIEEEKPDGAVGKAAEDSGEANADGAE